MSTPHPHANILRAIADGKRIQGRLNSSVPWVDAELINLAQEPECQFRIAPETVMVNGVECPKPVGNPHTETNWLVDISIGQCYAGTRTSRQHFVFATEEDAKTIYNALCKPFKSEGV